MNLGVLPSSPQRLKAGLYFALEEASDEGHCYKEKFQPKEEQLKDRDEKIEELQSRLSNASAQIKDRDEKIEYLMKENNELRDANSRPDEMISDLKTKPEAQSAEIAALLTSGVKLVEDMDIEIGKYTGPLRDGLPHGVGKWVDVYGSIYKGTWQNGKREGLFTGKNEEGRVYESNYKDGKPHGYQKTTDSDGTVYEENWKGGKRHGYQKRTCSDGTVYVT